MGEHTIHVPALHPFTQSQVEALQGAVNPSAVNPAVTESENDALDAAVVAAHAVLTTGTHGAGGSTIATTGNITTHAALTTHLTANERAGVDAAVGGAITAANPPLTKAWRKRHTVYAWGPNSYWTHNAASWSYITSRQLFNKSDFSPTEYDYYVDVLCEIAAGAVTAGLKLEHSTVGAVFTTLLQKLDAGAGGDWDTANPGKKARSFLIDSTTITNLAAGLAYLYISLYSTAGVTFYLDDIRIVAVPK